jgi:hypothetical protein
MRKKHRKKERVRRKKEKGKGDGDGGEEKRIVYLFVSTNKLGYCIM